MRYINRSKYQPLPEWIQKAQKKEQELEQKVTDEEKREFMKKTRNHIWKELRDSLLDLSYKKCWYSESKNCYSHKHVDHFRPKSEVTDLDGKVYMGYWWLAYKWDNYRVCGSVGNVHKNSGFAILGKRADCITSNLSDELPLLLDPCVPSDVIKLTFIYSGSIQPIVTDENKLDYKRAKYTIDTLDLNYPDLKEERGQVWMTCFRKLNRINTIMSKLESELSAGDQIEVQIRTEEVRDMMKSESEYSTMVRVCVLTFGTDWAIQMLPTM